MQQKQLELNILQALAERPSLHVMDLAEQIEEHPVAIDQACARLHDEGLISPSSHGIYDVTSHGQRRLDELDDAHR